MKTILNHLISCLGGAAIALLASSGGVLDQFTGTTATMWICAIVLTVVIMVMGVLLILSAKDLQTCDEYRTADAAAMEKDLRNLKRTVPTPPPGLRHKTYARPPLGGKTY